jgi:hypothetical protein
MWCSVIENAHTVLSLRRQLVHGHDTLFGAFVKTLCRHDNLTQTEGPKSGRRMTAGSGIARARESQRESWTASMKSRPIPVLFATIQRVANYQSTLPRSADIVSCLIAHEGSFPHGVKHFSHSTDRSRNHIDHNHFSSRLQLSQNGRHFSKHLKYHWQAKDTDHTSIKEM